MTGSQNIGRPEFIETLGHALARLQSGLDTKLAEQGRDYADEHGRLSERVELAQETLRQTALELASFKDDVAGLKHDLQEQVNEDSREHRSRLEQGLSAILDAIQEQTSSAGKIERREGDLEREVADVTRSLEEFFAGVESRLVEHDGRLSELVAADEGTAPAIDQLREQTVNLAANLVEHRKRLDALSGRDDEVVLLRQTVYAMKATDDALEKAIDRVTTRVEHEVNALREENSDQSAHAATALESASTGFHERADELSALIDESIADKEATAGQIDSLRERIAAYASWMEDVSDLLDEAHEQAKSVGEERTGVIARELDELTCRLGTVPSKEDLAAHDIRIRSNAESIDALGESIASAGVTQQLQGEVIGNLGAGLERLEQGQTKATESALQAVDLLAQKAIGVYNDIKPWERGGPAYKQWAMTRHLGGVWLALVSSSSEPDLDNEEWLLIVNGLQQPAIRFVGGDALTLEVVLTLADGTEVRETAEIPTGQYKGTYSSVHEYSPGDIFMKDGASFRAVRPGKIADVGDKTRCHPLAMRGRKGNRGDRGERGPMGPMVPLDLLRKQIEDVIQDSAGIPFRAWRGGWDYGTDYLRGDAVSAGTSVWIAIEANDGKVSPGQAGQETWALIISSSSGGGSGNGGGTPGGTDLSHFRNPSIVRIESSTGLDTTLEGATGSLAGVMTAAQANELADATSKNTEQDGRLDDVETSDSAQNGRLDSLETSDSAQNGRLDDLETSDSAQNGRLDDLETWDTEHLADPNPHGKMNWVSPYAPGSDRLENDVVLHNGWTMIANKDTSDPAAPSAVGEKFYIYDGASPTAEIVAKELTCVQVYEVPYPMWTDAIKIYTVQGYTYRVFAIDDPDGDNVYWEFAYFTAQTTGWGEIKVQRVLQGEGHKFMAGFAVQNLDPAPATFSGTWNYTTPNNANPNTGQVTHSAKNPDDFRINKTDADGTDRSAELATLEIGDVINGPGAATWTIQSSLVDNGTWFGLTVAPETVSSPNGLFEFVFEEVSASALEIVQDVDYFAAAPSISSQYQVDAGGAVLGNDALGIDIEFQQASISEDWDIVATSSGTSSASGGSGSTEDFAGAGTRGLVPDPVTEEMRFLRDDGTWAMPMVSPVGGAALSYRWSSDTDATEPDAGYMKGNNADHTLITEIYVSGETRPGNDVAFIWSSRHTGSYTGIWEDSGDHEDIYFEFEVEPVDNGGWFTIQVSVVPGSMGGMENGRAISVNLIDNPLEQVPPGGTTGQVLTKQSNSDYDSGWEDPLSGPTGAGGRKNLATNGNLRVHQRAPTSTNLSGTQGYISADMWNLSTGGAITTSIGSVGTDTSSVASNTGGGRLYLSSIQAHGVAAGDYYAAINHIENVDGAHLLWGTPDAKTVTLSFVAYANVAGTFFASVRSSDYGLAYVIPFTINTPLVKQAFSFVIPGPTNGNWNSSGRFGNILLSASVGTTYQAPATLSWEAGTYLGAAGGTNLGAAPGNIVSVGDIQLEEGSVATSFEFRHHSIERAMCRRFFKKDIRFYSTSNIITSGSCAVGVNFDTEMRATPVAQNLRASNVNLGTLSFVALNGREAVLTAPGSAAGNCTMNAVYDFSAEL